MNTTEGHSVEQERCPVTGLREYSLDPPHDRPMDPPDYFRELLGDCPVSMVSVGRGQQTAWLFTRYEDVQAVLSDTRFSSNPLIDGFPYIGTPGRNTPEIAKSMIRRDPPDHTRLRRMVTKDFMPRSMETFRPQIERIIDQHLDEMEAAGSPADFVQHFALPVPSAVIGLILGVPHEDFETFQRLTEDLVSKDNTLEEQSHCAREFLVFCEELIELKKQQPGDDVTTRLLQNQFGSGKLSHEELASFLTLLVSAGHDTTWGIFALAVPTLLGVPRELERLKSGEVSWEIAVEELVRHHSVVRQGPRRVATEDIEVNGHMVRKGEGVIAAVWSANHDPAVFDSWSTSEFTLPAQRRRHLGFGFGPHQCLGQSLARLELTYGLKQLFTRFPNLQLADGGQGMVFRLDQAIYGMTSTPVCW
ncbi:cytochrome P450 [Rhodococcus sp. NPDC056960]|uniref:cytochrome P450 n=1 Tax=Rhodococcus sp. NPDC056960 TaxID=3345982 RepID=UPI0036456F79